MILNAWRICKRHLQDEAFSLEHAKNGGRWNSDGIPIVYASGSVALAHMELLVHLKPADIHDKYVLCPCAFDASLVTQIDAGQLPPAWRDNPGPPVLRHIGDRWARTQQSPILAVPSALVPQEKNYLFNLLHPDFHKVSLCNKEPITLDPRLIKERELPPTGR